MSLAVDDLDFLEPDRVISGMAQGWDMAVALAAYCLDIPFIAAVPFPGQADRWPEADQRTYQMILAEASEVVTLYDSYHPDVYRYRDEWMVDHADVILALLDPEAPTQSGTGMTVRYANRKSVPVVNSWKYWLALGHGRR